MNSDREALQKLVTALDARHYGRMPDEVADAMANARAALAVPLQEPAAKKLKDMVRELITHRLSELAKAAANPDKAVCVSASMAIGIRINAAIDALAAPSQASPLQEPAALKGERPTDSASAIEYLKDFLAAYGDAINPREEIWAAHAVTILECALAAPSQAAPAIAERIAELEKRDSEAANHVEAVICLRTKFTGRPPYMGWKGLGLALTEALDERDALREALAAPLDAPSLTEQQKIAICKALLGYSNRKSINAIDAAMALSSKEPGNLSEAKGADGLPANAKRLWGDEPIDDQSW